MRLPLLTKYNGKNNQKNDTGDYMERRGCIFTLRAAISAQRIFCQIIVAGRLRHDSRAISFYFPVQSVRRLRIRLRHYSAPGCISYRRIDGILFQSGHGGPDGAAALRSRPIYRRIF